MNDFQFESHNAETHVSGVILDLDGTLLNTEQATKSVLKEFLARYGKVVDKEKENKRLGMAHKEAAICIVKDYDLPLTPDQYSQQIMPMYQEKWVQAKPLPGADRLIKHLHKHGVPFALASNSVRKHIDIKISIQHGWKEYFSVILGSDQVKSGKPSPDIFLEAANKMGVEAVYCLVIEDSLIGVKAAKAAEMNVVAVPSLEIGTDEYSIADTVLHSLLEFQPELWGLPPFEDWVDGGLPVEPIYIKGLYSNGLLREFTDGQSALPFQVSGLYFGWAKLNMHEVFKVVVSTRWEHNCFTSERNIQACLLDGSNEHIYDQELQLLLVGYIRGLCSMGHRSSTMEILEQDKFLARASLDLPAFVNHASTTFSSEVAFDDACAASVDNE